MILAFGKRLSVIWSATMEEIWPLGYSNTPFVHNLDRLLETPHFIYDILLTLKYGTTVLLQTPALDP